MNEPEEIRKAYIKKRTKVFSKYFKNKNIDEGIYNILKDSIVELMSTYMRFLITCDCIEFIRDNYSLDADSKNRISEIVTALKHLCEDLDSILQPIADGMSSD